jgi:xanthine dehydrogenase small subunit
VAEGLRLWIDGNEERVGGVPVALTLLEYLRTSGRVGTKEGCAEGDCGACTVALRDGDGFLAVNSCLVPLAAVAGREVVTAEGLAQGGTLHPVQEALARAGGSQCGYCTPGFVMSLFAATYAGEREDSALEGNLCRCTGYRPIREAARSLSAPAEDDPFLAFAMGAEADHYSAGDERFFHPKTLSEALELLTQPGAKAIAGGTDVGVEMNKFGRRYPVLVALSGVPELKRLRETAVGLELGGALTLSELEAQLQGRLPLLETMIRAFAARQIRNLATLGGNLATASPVGDLAPVLLAAGAQLTLASRRGERTLALGDFFTGYRTTLLDPDELILTVTVPLAEPSRLEAVYKVGKRGADDISTVAAAFSLGLSPDGSVCSARLAYGGVAATPVRAAEVEAFLLGKPWTGRTAAEAAARLRALFTPLSDLRGSADYRRALVGNLFEKFFYEHPGIHNEVAA